MFSVLRTRLLCGTAAERMPLTRLNEVGFVGRVGTASNPRNIAPVITSNVINGSKTISFDCISRKAAAIAVHATAIANTKNAENEIAAFLKIEISEDPRADQEIPIGRGLTTFKITMFPSVRPEVNPITARFARRMRVGGAVSANELAKNIHSLYLKRTPVILECMGDAALGVVSHGLGIFNQRVGSHNMVAYLRMISGKANDGADIVKMEFQLSEKESD